ncbi:DUF1488 domain-containing protein [Candidatus Sodalis pierantonius]|uniref:DUF1488 domain-containing protein n=1 Tax=Candidatus Sodalis pierantonii TaxID=1486991 RepID=UPI00090064BE|nr:DUF1488 domain-containing protein [Candidatus Sodalis pierantonius]
MNQAIHFPDLEQWDAERQSVCFPALVGGMRAECQVSAGWLCSRFSSAASPYRILCKCLFSEVTVQAVTELDNKAAHCHAPVPQRHCPFL